MKLLFVLVSMLATALALAESASMDVAIFYQVISPSNAPATLLAEASCSLAQKTCEIKSYESPEIPAGANLVRVGAYDPQSATWKSSTAVTSIESFSKGYSPTIIISIDADGQLVGVGLKSGIIDAGWTRDFGPKVKLVQGSPGTKPLLNKPVVLSKEGKAPEDVPEKTFLQKYWWLLLAGAILLLGGGGGDGK